MMGTTAEPKPGEKGGDASHPLALQKADMAALSDTQRADIALAKNANIVTAQLAGTNWGKGLDEPTRRAVADWGRRNMIDVTTEIFVLGGSIYLNAQFYINRLVGLLHRGLVLDYKQEFIQHDERLDQIIAEAIDPKLPADLQAIAEEERRDAFKERARRRRLRIEHGAPEKSAVQGPGVQPFAVAVTTLTLAAMPNTPIRGVKWAPHDANDPVGKAYPQETALTRSARRALKQCVTHIPELARWVDGSAEDAAHSVAVAVREHHQRALEEERRRPAIAPGAPVAQADYLASGAATPITRPHAEDATEVRGPVAVTPAPAETPRHASDTAWTEGRDGGPPPHHEVRGDVADAQHDGRSLEDQLGPLGAGAGVEPGEEIDDLDLLSDEERREHAERKRAGRK